MEVFGAQMTPAALDGGAVGLIETVWEQELALCCNRVLTRSRGWNRIVLQVPEKEPNQKKERDSKVVICYMKPLWLTC